MSKPRDEVEEKTYFREIHFLYEILSSLKDVEEVKIFFTSLGNPSKAVDFFDFYSSKGWVVGKSPMKDWQAAARRWARTSFDSPGSQFSDKKRVKHFQGTPST